MEAATAGQAPAQAEPQQTETNQEAPENQGIDIGDWQRSVDSRLGDAADGIRQMAELVNTRLPEPQGEPEVDFAQQLEELLGGDPQGYGQQVDPQAFAELFDQRATSKAQELIAPFVQQLSQMQEGMTARELDALQESFPELNDPARDQSGLTAADRLAEQVVSKAEAMGVPQLANNPDFVRMVHLNQKAQAQATQETPAGQGPEPPHVEQGGAAAPGSSEGDRWGDIAGAGRTTSGPIW